MAEPEAMAAMEWIRDRMWDDQVMATFLDVQNMSTRQAFIAGRVAMVEDGSWALKDILAEADFRIGVAPFPAGPVRRVTLATTDGFGIYAGTKHPDAAWELLKFLISKDYGRAMARTNFLQPARASLVDEWAGFIRQEFPQKTKDVDIAVFADGHIKGGQKAMQAGFQLSEYWMPGLGGKEMWQNHAENTARVLNAINPHYIRSRPLFPQPGTAIFEWLESGDFQLSNADEQLIELKLMMEKLSVSSKVCFDHAGNYWRNRNGGLLLSHSYEGYKFPEEKQRVLDLLDEGLKAGNRVPEFLNL